MAVTQRPAAVRPVSVTATARRARVRRRLAVALTYAAGVLCALVLGFPFYWMLTGAFKAPQELTSVPPTIFPLHWTIVNVQQAWSAFDFARYFWNSAWLALVRSSIPAFMAALCGYVLAKIAFRGRGVIFVGLLVTMMLPGAITLIPSYLLMFRLHWIGTYWPLIVPSMFSAYGTFLMRQLMMGLPNETLDAGRIDGASEWNLFLHIALPSMWPGVAAVFILSFIGAWDDFLWPLMVLNDPSMFTLPVGLAFFTLQHYTLLGPLMAATVLTTLPMIAVFYVGQRRIVDSGLFAGLHL